MLKPAIIGVLAPLVLAGWPAMASLRTPIAGAHPTLPPRFIPMRFEVLPPRAPGGRVLLRDALDPPAANGPIWNFPLLDRHLSQAERTAVLAPDLVEAIGRIEPMYDPTRLDETEQASPMAVSAGTAVMNNVFADRWRRADPDPNVNAKVPTIGMAWQETGPRPCDAFTKNRMHGRDDAALTALTPEDCRALRRFDGRGIADEPPVPIVVGRISVPVFAAPLPGSRMSSEAFWAARRARIAEIHARLRQKWTAGGMPVAEVRAAR